MTHRHRKYDVIGELISRDVLERVAFFQEEGLSIQGLRDYTAEYIDVLREAEEG